MDTYLTDNFQTTGLISQVIVASVDGAAPPVTARFSAPSEEPTVPPAAYTREAANKPDPSARSAAVQAAPSDYDTPVWAPSSTQFEAYEFNGVANMYGVYFWDNGPIGDSGLVPHSPTYVPDDHGMELEYSLWNYDLPEGALGTGCTIRRYTEFWASHGTGSEPQVQSWNVFGTGGISLPLDDIGAYFDGNILFDDCQRLNFGVGIGFPDNVPMTSPDSRLYELQTLVTAQPGTESSSIHSIGFQGVSNDCNDVGSAPDSDCMDLNSGREWPGPGSETGLALNIDRAFTAPGCVSWSSFTLPQDSDACLP